MQSVYGWPPTPPRPPRLAGIKHQAVLGLCVFLAVFLTPLRGLLDSGWGWVALVSAVVLWNLLAAYRPRQWPRVLAAGGVAVVLALAVTTAAAAPTPKAKPKHRKTPARVEQTVNLDELRGTVADQWERLASLFSKYAPLSKEGR